MATDGISSHPALRQLARRVRARWLLRTFHRALLVAFAGLAAVTLAGRLLDMDGWPLVGLGWTVLVLLGALALGVVRAPTEWAIAREADALGLAERVSSALYARAATASVAELIEADARSALDGLDPRRYSLIRGSGAWRSLGVALAVLGILLVVPLPRLGQAADARDAQRVAAAEQRVEAMQLQPPSDKQLTELQTRTAEQLQALREALARSSSSQAAARAIEDTQRQLAHLPNSDDYAARRSADAVAQALESQPHDVLIPLAQALRAHDAHAVDQALADLSARLDTPGSTTDAQRADAQLALQAAANAASATQPRLAGALRKAASGVAAQQSGALADKNLQDALDQTATDAAALDKLEQTLTDLGQLRAAALPAGATLVVATGTPTAYTLVSGTPPPNATPVGLGVAAAGQTGARGQGADNGAPGSGASPNGTTPYDPVYAPSHLGGEPGPQVQVSGAATDARGASVDLPQGPVSAGDVRPYDQVYAQYAQEARQSAARQSLPPNVQALVDRYFGAIAPTPGAASP
jgi:hypothetical protein